MSGRESVLDNLTVDAILRYAGLEPPNARGWFKCPIHGDTNPSCHVVPNSKDRAWRCFACSARGGVIDLAVALGFGRDRATAAHMLEEALR